MRSRAKQSMNSPVINLMPHPGSGRSLRGQDNAKVSYSFRREGGEWKFSRAPKRKINSTVSAAAAKKDHEEVIHQTDLVDFTLDDDLADAGLLKEDSVLAHADTPALDDEHVIVEASKDAL